MESRRVFPLFINLQKQPVVVCGGGRIATRRVRVLLDFGPELFVYACSFSEELQQLEREHTQLHLIRQNLQSENLACIGAERTPYLLLAATDDSILNEEIWQYGKQRNILVNVASDRKKCDFFFPAIINREELVIGVAGDGRSHRRVKELAAWLRMQFRKEDQKK